MVTGVEDIIGGVIIDIIENNCFKTPLFIGEMEVTHSQSFIIKPC